MCPSGTSHSQLHPISTTADSNALYFRQAFNLIDTDHDGRISKDDLRSFCSRLPNSTMMADEDLIRTMIYVADSNKDGFVEYDEFQRVLLSSGNYKGEGKGKRIMGMDGGGEGGGREVMEDMFGVMDQDGDGKVGFNDLKRYLSRAGLSVSDDDVRSMIQLGSGDHDDDGVSFEGFLRIFGVDSLSSLFP